MKILMLFSILVVSCVVAGCGDGAVGTSDRPETTPVSVTITYKSAPVSGATVTFSPKNAQGGKPAYGQTDKKGVVELNAFTDVEGVVPGEYKVLVTKVEVAAGQGIPMDDPKYTGDLNMTPKTPPTSLIPEKYSIATTSTLEATVKSGEDNSFPFELVD